MIVVQIFPLFNCLPADVFFTQYLAGHVIRGINIKEKKKNDEVYPDNNGNGIQTAPDNVGSHGNLPI
jgi:hypothetical protein